MSSSISGVGGSSGLPPGIPPLPGGPSSGAVGSSMRPGAAGSQTGISGLSGSSMGMPATGMPGASTTGLANGVAGTQGSNPFSGFSGTQLPGGLAGGQGSGAASGASGTQATGNSASQPSDATSGTSGTGSASSASGEDTFLKLLVAQMQNQDPSSPMDTTSFVTELAQFNTVEQMINMQQTMQSALSTEQGTEGTVLLGRTVTYTVPSLDGSNPTVGQGLVSAVSLGSGGVQVQVNGQSIPLGQVTAVSP